MLIRGIFSTSSCTDLLRKFRHVAVFNGVHLVEGPNVGVRTIILADDLYSIAKMLTYTEYLYDHGNSNSLLQLGFGAKEFHV